jgi:citrate lyase subunit beta/citryl-CoA lyase
LTVSASKATPFEHGALPAHRSLLYLPAWNAEVIAAARVLPCDAVILCLEDATPAEQKADGRSIVAHALARGGFAARQVVVRVNSLDSEWGEADLFAIMEYAPDVVLAPMIRSAEELAAYRRYLARETEIWAMVETAEAALRIDALCGGGLDADLTALVLGTNDLARSLKARPGPGREVLWPVFTTTIAAARAHGLAVYDGIFMDVENEEGFVAQCRQAWEFGFDGKTLLSPRQIEACNAVFGPTK